MDQDNDKDGPITIQSDDDSNNVLLHIELEEVSGQFVMSPEEAREIAYYLMAYADKSDESE